MAWALLFPQPPPSIEAGVLQLGCVLFTHRFLLLLSLQDLPSIEARVLQLGYVLFTQREYRPLADLTRLVLGAWARGFDSSEQLQGAVGEAAGGGHAGMHLLRGLSLACQLGEVQVSPGFNEPYNMFSRPGFTQ